MTIGIAGLGLIGGSMAKSIRAHSGHRTLGMDINPDAQRAALDSGTIQGVLTPENMAECDVVMAALYPQAAVDFFLAHESRIRPGALALDLCGVKRAVCGPLFARFENAPFTFMGGHPMAGREFSGFAASRENLFEKASMILAPMPGASPESVAFAERVFLEIGFARVKFTTPQEHDRVIALTSQLAHIVSGAYVRSPQAAHHSGFSAGSFQDMTRVARLKEDMWAELMLDNRDYLLDELSGLIQRLCDYRDALACGDSARLSEILREGRAARESLD